MKTTLTIILIIQLYGLTFMKQHYFINRLKTWDNAREYCRNYFYGLSTFPSKTEEQQFLLQPDAQTYEGWIGLYKVSGIWRWTGAAVSTQLSWDTGQPYEGACAFHSIVQMKLHTLECNRRMTFFCMTVEAVLVQQTETWETALDYCRDHYGDLASLSSNASMDSALSKTPEAQTQYVWIGLRFLAGQWFWVSGDDLEYKAWSVAGEPQCPARNQRCGALDTNTNTWAPRDCQEKLNFLCF